MCNLITIAMADSETIKTSIFAHRVQFISVQNDAHELNCIKDNSPERLNCFRLLANKYDSESNFD